MSLSDHFQISLGAAMVLFLATAAVCFVVGYIFGRDEEH